MARDAVADRYHGQLMGAPGAVRLARSSLLNMVGQALPLLAALAAIPLLVTALGTERFGVLTLAWALVGYFGLFDFGLGRALTQVVAQHLGEGHRQAPAVAWPVLAALTGIGALGGVLLWWLAPWIVGSALALPAELHAESVASLRLLALSVPVATLTAGLAGLLAAFHRFGVMNAIRAPMGMLSFLAPLLVMGEPARLDRVVAALVVVRAAGLLAHVGACAPLVPRLHEARSVRAATLRPLLTMSAWMAVTNLIAPVLLYLDRFVITAMLTATAAAHYATPYEMVTRLLFVSGAIGAVLFPAFASKHVADRAALASLATRGTKYVGLALSPMLLVIVAFAPELLTWWLDESFAREATPVLRILAVGVLINATAQVTFALIQGIGRADAVARLHLLETPLYVGALVWAVSRHGIVGAAWAWTGRVALDALLLGWYAGRAAPETRAAWRRVVPGVAGAVAAVAVPAFIAPFAPRAVVTFIMLAAAVVLAWQRVLSDAERGALLGLRRSLGRA